LRVNNLAINQSGFAFDPTTGESFTLNESAKKIIELISEGLEEKEIAKRVSEEFDVDEKEAYNDVLDFKERLGLYGLLS